MLQTLACEVPVAEFNKGQSASTPIHEFPQHLRYQTWAIARIMNRHKISEHILKTNYLLLLDVTWNKILVKFCAPFQTITGTSLNSTKHYSAQRLVRQSLYRKALLRKEDDWHQERKVCDKLHERSLSPQ